MGGGGWEAELLYNFDDVEGDEPPSSSVPASFCESSPSLVT